MAALGATEPTLADTPRAVHLEASPDRVGPSKILKVAGTMMVIASGVAAFSFLAIEILALQNAEANLVDAAFGQPPRRDASGLSEQDMRAFMISATAAHLVGLAMILVGSFHERLGFDLDNTTHIDLGVGAPGTPAGATIMARF